MPYLRIHSPEVSFEQRKIMATELTDAIITALQLTNHTREEVTIHFIPYRLENMAVGGRLLCETEAPIYRLEFFGAPLPSIKQQQLKHHVLTQALELLGLSPSESHRLTLSVFEQAEPVSLASPHLIENASR